MRSVNQDGSDARSSGGRRQPPYSLFEKAVFGLALGMFVAMILATLAQIVFRYVLEVPVAWTEEAARSLFVLAMLMGIAFAYREGEHVVVDFAFARLPPAVRRRLAILFNLLILGFIAFSARGAWRLAELNWTSTLITIPFFRVAYFYVWQLAALALLFVYVVLDTLAQVRARGPAVGGNT